MKIIAFALGVLLAAAPAVSADTFLPGFEHTAQPLPGQVASRTLSDGRYVTMDGTFVDLWAEDGTFLMNLGTFPVPGTTGAFAVHPTETWVLVGESDSGLIFRIELDGSGATLLTDLDRNRSADWENNQFALVSAGTGLAGPAYELWRLNTVSGATDILAALDGAPGPVAVDSTGAAFCATNSATAPPPPGSSDVYRFQASDLVAQTGGAYTVNDDDILVIQVESTPPTGDWVEETSEPGYTGESYYRWAGPDQFNTPGVGTLSWDFTVTTAGNYQARVYNHHDDPDSTLENDCWMRMDGGPWFKVFSGGNVDVWNWASSFDLAPDPSVPANWDLTVGEHTVEISGRSNDFRIDRFHLYLDGAPSPLNLALPQSSPGIQGEEVAQLLFENLHGVPSMAVDRETDTTYIAESNVSLGVGRIHVFGKNFPSTPLLVNGDGLGAFAHLQFIREPGAGIFFPFQPLDTGKLYYNRLDLQSLTPERYLVRPRRPELTVSGPGTDGLGLVTLEFAQGWPHGWTYLFVSSLAAWLPVEEQWFFDGIILHTGMDTAAYIFLNVPLPQSGTGSWSLTFENATGLVDFAAFQMLITNLQLRPLGTTTGAFL